MAEKARKRAANIIIEFLDVAFNCILYSRNVYPPKVFLPRKKYGVAVYQTSHVKVKRYIANCLRSFKKLLLQDVADKVALVVHKDGRAFEKHVFQMLPPSLLSDDSLFVTEEVFREYILKLGLSKKSVAPPPNACFSIEVTTNAQNALEITQSPSQFIFPWVEMKSDDIAPLASIVPIKTLGTKDIAMQMYIEAL